MVTYKEKDKDLVIPASLGNFKTNGGGGGVTPEEVQIMINTSISGYDATVQEEFNTTNSGVSENAQNIEALSGKTQEIETSLENYATTAQTSEIASGLTELSGVTEQLSQSVGEKANASDLEALSGVTGQVLQDIESLSVQTSGLSAQIEAVSGAIPTVEVEQVVSAGTKIATVSVNGVGTDLFAPDGGSQEEPTVKYLTEDIWPGAYWEVGTGEMNKWGASILRPDNTEIFETYFRTNECTVMGEGNIGNTGSGEGNLKITDENDHIMLDKKGNRYVFKMDFTNGKLYFYHSPDQTGNFTYRGAQGTQYVTGYTTGTVHIELAKVLSGNTWIQKDEILFPKTYFIDAMSDAERVELYNYIKYSGPKISPIAKYCRFLSEIDGKDGFMGMCEVYFCRFDSGTYLSFTGSVPSRNSNLLFKVKFNIHPNGSIQGKTITEYDLTPHS